MVWAVAEDAAAATMRGVESFIVIAMILFLSDACLGGREHIRAGYPQVI